MSAVCVGSDDRGKVMGVDTVSSNAEMLVEYGMPAAFVAATLYLAWAGPDFSTLTTLLGRKISLRDAAAQLYTKFRGTTVGALMEGSAATASDGVLDNAAAHILHHLPLEARRSPSRKWEPLDPLALGGLTACGGATGLGLTACGGATGLRFVGQSDVAYPEVRVKARDLRRLIRAYQAEAHPLASFG